ncbi:FHA domain-containing protein [Streptomyces sp. URMC 129]|uniref:FHA domain-containing protein n=1 Tax=Streptomyces sp. URMC 129 TaxID=3423407 RepID=UPI003F1AB3B2
MTSVEFSAHSPRVSDADRERALDVLREGVVDGRVSQDTFLRRVEVVMTARLHDELFAVLHDLPGRQPRPAPTAGWFVGSVARLAALRRQLRLAWRSERLPQLLLPAPAREALTIGRAPGSGLRLSDASVSRHHARLRGTGTGWLLSDLGSANGTWVNGRRVADTVPVGPGDQVRFGAVSFLLTVVTADR